MLRNFFLISLIFFVTSCGFQVIYKEKQDGISYEKELAAIKIQKETGKLSQELRNALYDFFNPDSLQVEPKYALILDVTSYTTSTFTTSTGSSGRNRIVLTANYKFLNIKTAELLTRGQTIVGDNYDVQANRFGTYAADEYTKSNVTKIAAQNIRNLLVNDIIELQKKDQKKKELKVKKSPQ